MTALPTTSLEILQRVIPLIFIPFELPTALKTGRKCPANAVPRHATKRRAGRHASRQTSGENGEPKEGSGRAAGVPRAASHKLPEPHQGSQCRRDGTETSMPAAKRLQFNDPPCFTRFRRQQPRAKPYGAIIANRPTAMQKAITALKSIACHLKHVKSA